MNKGKNENIIVGVDISKDKLDTHCLKTEEDFILKNNINDIEKLDEWMKCHKFDAKNILIVFENTGMYTSALLQYCNKRNITHYMLSGLELKKSLGIARGKNDKVDAKRIATYLFEKLYKLTPEKPTNKVLEELARLNSYRESLVKTNTAFKTRLKEQLEVLNLSKKDILVVSQQKILKEIQKQIEQIENEIQEKIKEDVEIKENYKLITSVTGIGPVIATYLIIVTANFTKFTDARKLGSYAGVVPFSNQSGKFKGKNRTSPLANKRLKSLLEMGARSAIVHDPELKLYYQRKMAQNKNERVVRNAVRFKLLTRICAVVRKKQPFVKNHVNNLVK